MSAKDSRAALARLLADLANRAGDDLDRALADSALVFAGLGACAAPRRAGGPDLPDRIVTLVRAQRELSGLIARELLRLCELSLAVLRNPAACALGPHDLAELLHEELDCAQQLGDLPSDALENLRELALRLPTGAAHSGAFEARASMLRCHARLELIS